MKIAIPYKEGMVNPHFGQSREFIISEKKEKVPGGVSTSGNIL
jgi:predicted Fe-Mo cluster-binding NifX family protein